MKILNPNETYTFSKFFDLNAEADDIVADFGYSLSREKLNLPLYSGELGRLQELRDRIEEILPFVN
jgi:predicted metallo-beta-lactamase superfamily hydrolase